MGVILVQAGALRVYIQSEDGRDITLFRIEEGEACILSASCFMQEITFEILIDAEEDSRVTVIPTAVFKKLSDENIYVVELGRGRVRLKDKKRLKELARQ